jgi:hypothetical protein
MAILKEDHPKIINATLEETIDVVNLLVDILNIKVITEDDFTHMDRQMVLVVDLIRTKFGKLTIPEIREAFKMYVAKEFVNVRVFRLLDCVSVGEILNAYINTRDEVLIPYLDQKRQLLEKPPEKSEDEKKQIKNEFLKTVFQELKETRKCNDSWILYDDLEAAGKIKNTKEEKKKLYNKFLQSYILEEKKEIKGSGAINAKGMMEAFVNKIESKVLITAVQNRCKSFLVNDYFVFYLDDFETFKTEFER